MLNFAPKTKPSPQGTVFPWELKQMSFTQSDDLNRIERNNRFDIGLYEQDKPLLWSLQPCFHRKNPENVLPRY